MNGSEHVHECVGSWTDDGVWQVSPDEPIVRCKDCKHVYEHHDARGRWLLCNLQLYFEVKPDGFCSRGEKEGRMMDGKKRARLVERDRNHFHRGQYEIWDIGDGNGIYVDFNPCPYGIGNPETMAFTVDLRKYSVTSWQKLGYWPYDATGGEAIRELGYEPVEEGGADDTD